MRKLKIISVICAVSFASIASSNPLCSLKEGPGKKIIKIDDIPGYFFKVHPDGKYLSFIGPSSNKLMNLETGAQYPTPGNVDPVWSPDGKFLTYPDAEKGSLSFHHGDELINSAVAGDATKSTTLPSEYKGVYQSIGANGSGYRM
ncbi:MAG: PD40 domain-containing protein, partial [Bdellovibrionales bacterium]|nr:PD40 domain-containing protein [Bdellovibrionales bacterium]